MRRFFYWYLPIVAALVAALTFGSGFYSFLRGDTGKPVEFVAQRRNAPAPARTTIAPIILGDSLARGAGDESGLGIGGRLDRQLIQRKLPATRTINLGINGARTADLLRQLQSANVQRLLGQANVIVVSIGGNDLWGGSDWRNATPDDPDAVMNGVLDRIEQVMKVVREQNSSARIFLIGLYNPFRDAPMGSQLTGHINQWNAKLIERFSADQNLSVVQTADLFSHRDRLALDRFHPGDEGYELIARRIADAL